MEENSIEIKLGDPQDELSGKTIILQEHPQQIKEGEVLMNKLRCSFLGDIL